MTSYAVGFNLPRFQKRFVYLMQFDERRTTQYLSKAHLRIVDRKFFNSLRKRGKKYYWGWVAFDKPISLYDAMEGGLVPSFRNVGRGENEAEK